MRLSSCIFKKGRGLWQFSPVYILLGSAIQVDLVQVQEVLGLIGAGLYLLSYFSLQIGWIHGRGYAYPTLNMLAASFVLIDLERSFNVPSAVIQVSWIAISLFGIVRLTLIFLKMRFSDEERHFLDYHLADVDRKIARHLLDAGRWEDVPIGTVLATYGQPVDDLVYIASGEISCGWHGDGIHTFSTGNFIGEFTCLDKAPATANCVVTKPARLLRFNAERLRKLTKKDAMLRLALQSCFAVEMRKKIIASDMNYAAVSVN